MPIHTPLFKQRLAHLKPFLRYLIVGGMNTLFGYGAFALLLYLGLHYALAYLIAFCGGILFNFKTTGQLVFKNSRPDLLIRFLLVYGVLYFINIGLLKLMVIFHINLYQGSAITLFPMAFLAYWLNKKCVFNPSSQGFSMTFQFDPNRQVPQSFVIASAFILLLLCYHLIFGSYFPNYQDRLGVDYSFLLPELLNGYFWFKTNSIWDVPWFTPAFCGGQPFFADVQSIYYSLAQGLTLWLDPLTSVYVSIILFAALGFWGMYFLLLRRFLLTVETSFLGATLFMFNGFYAHRMLIGHFGFQGFMLIPLIAFLLISVTPAKIKNSILSNSYKTLFAGLLIAYWLQSGLASLMIPTALAVLAIACLAKPTFAQGKLFCTQAAIAGALALALSASKLVAGLTFMSYFQRSHYSLPGLTDIFSALKLLFTALFFAPADIAEQARPMLVNVQIGLDRHEWEFGVGIVPLLIILTGWGVWLWRKLRAVDSPAASAFAPLATTLLAVILILPLAINLYHPAWNAVLKQTPLLKSSSTLFRWWLIYIPLVIIYAAQSLEELALPQKYRAYGVAACISLILLLNLTADRLFYHYQNYSPADITAAYQQVAQGKPIPFIKEINAFRDDNNVIQSPVNRNDLLAVGVSQLACYNPSFGYHLENFPAKSLHIGSVFDQTAGVLNVKNPACYVFPTENHCLPGAHFSVADKAQATAFVHYRPFTFAISDTQKIANGLTELALLLVSGFLLYTLVIYLNKIKALYDSSQL